MARIRSIKPEFWTSEQVMECSPNARLLFIGMWNFADDCGRLPCSAKSLKAQIFPSDDISVENIRGMINELSANGLVLIYSVEDKDYLQITGWSHQRIDKPQPAKYPAPFFDGSPTVPRTLPPDRIGEDKKGKEKEKNSRSVAAATRPGEHPKFEEFWRSFPRRDGPNPRKPAEQKFSALAKTGVDPDVMIAGAKQLSIDESRRGNIGTRFIPQAVTWLSQQRWADHAAAVFEVDDGLVDVRDQRQLDAWDDYGRKTHGKGYPRDRHGGWRFPSKWPPGYEDEMVSSVLSLVQVAK